MLLKCYLYLMFQYCCDSDGEDEVVNLEPIYESSKSYHHRQLPDIIGTTDFMVRYNHIIINSITRTVDKKYLLWSGSTCVVFALFFLERRLYWPRC